MLRLDEKMALYKIELSLTFSANCNLIICFLAKVLLSAHDLFQKAKAFLRAVANHHFN